METRNVRNIFKLLYKVQYSMDIKPYQFGRMSLEFWATYAEAMIPLVELTLPFLEDVVVNSAPFL